MNVVSLSKFRQIFQPRDLFLHDGSSLRRFHLPTGTQVALLAATLALIGWAVFAAVQLAAPAQAPRIAKPAISAELQAMRQQVAALKADVEARYHTSAHVVQTLGLEPKRFHGTRALAMGGPFEPLTAAAKGEPADPQFRSLFVSWKKLDQLEQGMIAIPSARPLKADVDLTSGYGVRSDPFRGSAAMHAGVDLAGPVGTPIFATADGIVGRSEWASGYGNLIEIEHGKGIQTRYGHLSKTLVKAGTRVKRGDLVGLMGSTGRSTGSHLHYEVRIDGRAVNPVPFLQSSDYILAVQRRAQTTQIALGGPED